MKCSKVKEAAKFTWTEMCILLISKYCLKNVEVSDIFTTLIGFFGENRCLPRQFHYYAKIIVINPVTRNIWIIFYCSHVHSINEINSRVLSFCDLWLLATSTLLFFCDEELQSCSSLKKSIFTPVTQSTTAKKITIMLSYEIFFWCSVYHLSSAEVIHCCISFSIYEKAMQQRYKDSLLFQVHCNFSSGRNDIKAKNI